MLQNFISAWSIIRPLGKSCHLLYLMVIWYISSRFGMLHQQKSGKPVVHQRFRHKRKDSTFFLRRETLVYKTRLFFSGQLRGPMTFEF
jgi:hypothetical protein